MSERRKSPVHQEYREFGETKELILFAVLAPSASTMVTIHMGFPSSQAISSRSLLKAYLRLSPCMVISSLCFPNLRMQDVKIMKVG